MVFIRQLSAPRARHRSFVRVSVTVGDPQWGRELGGLIERSCRQLSATMMGFGRARGARSSLRLPSITLGTVGHGLRGPSSSLFSYLRVLASRWITISSCPISHPRLKLGCSLSRKVSSEMDDSLWLPR